MRFVFGTSSLRSTAHHIRRVTPTAWRCFKWSSGWKRHKKVNSLHCTALHCTALHCTALHCTALHCIALHCIALHCTALHCTALHFTALHCTCPQVETLPCTVYNVHCTLHTSPFQEKPFFTNLIGSALFTVRWTYINHF